MPFLVELAKAAVCGRAFGEPELAVVDAEIGFGGRIVEGIDDGDRLLRGGEGRVRQRVGSVQQFGCEAAGDRYLLVTAGGASRGFRGLSFGIRLEVGCRQRTVRSRTPRQPAEPGGGDGARLCTR